MKWAKGERRRRRLCTLGAKIGSTSDVGYALEPARLDAVEAALALDQVLAAHIDGAICIAEGYAASPAKEDDTQEEEQEEEEEGGEDDEEGEEDEEGVVGGLASARVVYDDGVDVSHGANEDVAQSGVRGGGNGGGHEGSRPRHGGEERWMGER